MHGLLEMRIPNFIATVFVSLITASCGFDTCDNSVVSELASEDGSSVATIFERSCGAPSPKVTVVAMRAASDKFNPERHKDWVFTIHGDTVVEVEWDGNGRINVSYTATGDSPTMREEWGGVQVIYK